MALIPALARLLLTRMLVRCSMSVLFVSFSFFTWFYTSIIYHMLISSLVNRTLGNSPDRAFQSRLMYLRLFNWAISLGMLPLIRPLWSIDKPVS